MHAGSNGCCQLSCAPVAILRRYFGVKLSEFSQARQNSIDSSGSDGDEEEQAEAMDIGSGPQPAASVMGQQWADQLPQVLTFLQQLGLQVHLLHPVPAVAVSPCLSLSSACSTLNIPL